MSIVDDAKALVQGVAQAAMEKAVELAPDSWIPGGKPDPLSERRHGLIGAQLARIDGPLKVQGGAVFSAEVAMEGMAHAALAFSTIARGRIVALDTAAAEAAPGVVAATPTPSR
jgi:xanthine dehydrogenase YagR molybdenum-binding subunit